MGGWNEVFRFAHPQSSTRVAHPESPVGQRRAVLGWIVVRVLFLCPPASFRPPLTRPRHAPLFTLSAAAAVRKAGFEVQIQDSHRTTLDPQRIVTEALAARPDAIFVMVADYNRRIGDDVLRRLSETFEAQAPSVALLLFGRLNEEVARTALLRCPQAKGAVFGEAEAACVAVLTKLRDGQGAAGSPGLVWMEAGAAKAHPPAPPALDDLPVPAWDLLPPHLYPFSPHQQEKDPVFPVLASRGCPYPCFYCEVRGQAKYQSRSVDSVLGEIRELHGRFGARSFFLADPTFSVDRRWGLEFCARLREEGPKGVRWSCMSRTDRVDDELLAAMAAAGCWNVLYGIESLEDTALAGARKNLDPATVGPAIAAAQRHGIEVIASIMIGLPGDTPQGVERTIEAIIRHEPDYAQFFVVQVDSPEPPEGGRYLSEREGGRYEFFGRVYASDAFTGREQLLALRRHAFRRFYLRPGYVVRQVRRMARRGDLPAELRRAATGAMLAVRLAAGERLR